MIIFRRVIAVLLVFCMVIPDQAFALDQIITDGKTDTSLSVNGSVTDVYTDTIHGSNAYNSFEKFDVYIGNTVNLYVPNSAASLINVVSKYATNIDGVLNSIKNGAIGGNVYILNPNGISVGADGVVNVGSLTMSTPKKGFVDGFFTDVNAATAALMDGSMPISSSALISIAGRINTISDVDITAGNINVSGIIKAGQKNDDIAFADVVNDPGTSSENELYIDKDGNIEIRVMAEDTAVLESTAEINAGAEGFIELSSKDTVKLMGGALRAVAALIDPENLEISTNQFTYGTDLTFQADRKITVFSNVIISSRQVVSGDSHITGASIGSSGDITLEAMEIELREGAKILTYADNGYTGGDINICATDEMTFMEDTHAKITMTDVLLKGRNIDIVARADSAHYFDEEDEDAVGEVTLDILDSVRTIAGWSTSHATAEITVEGDSQIIATDDVNIEAEADSEAQVLCVGTGLGVAFGVSEAEALITIGGNTEIEADNVTITADTEAESTIEAYTVNLGAGRGATVDVTVAVNDLTTDSTITLGEDTSIVSRGNVEINAVTSKEMNTSALAGAYEDGTVGAAIAISTSSTNAEVAVDGSIDAAGDVLLKASSDCEKNDTAASAAVGSGKIAGKVIGAANAVIDKVQSFFSSKKPAANSSAQASGSNDLSAAFAYADHENNASVRIGGTADVKARGGDLILDADISTVVEFSAVATIDATSTAPVANALSAAVLVAMVENNSEAVIEDSAIVDALNAINVTSDVSMPYEIQWHQIAGVSDITDKLNPNIGIQNGFFTTWAQSNCQSDNVGAAGSVNFFKVTNNSDAIIGENAQINQDDSISHDQQILNVSSYIDVETVNLSGVFGLKGVGVSSGKTGIGGSYLDISCINNAKAKISDNVSINSEAVTVEAETVTKNISIAEAGGAAGKYGINGSFSIVDTANTTEATVENTVDIRSSAADSVAEALTITASDDSQIYSIAGGITKAKNAGVGASVALNEISRTTKAAISDDDDLADAVSVGIDTGDIVISARNKGQLSAWSLAAAVTANTPDPEVNVKTDVNGGGKYGISVSGDVSLNEINDNAYAYIENAQVNDSDSALLSAGNTTDIDTVSGSASVSAGTDGTAGLAGSYSQNMITNTARAYMSGSDITTGDLDMDTYESGDIQAIAASGSFATRAGIAGSVTINKINDTLLTYVLGSTLNCSSATLDAKSETAIESLAGAVSGGGKAAFGASVSYNEIDNAVKAYVESSNVIAASLRAAALSSQTIRNLSAGVAVSGSGSIAGGLSLNTINIDTSAFADDSEFDLTDDLVFDAEDDSIIRSLAGQAAGASKVAIGAAAAYNDVSNDVSAYMNDSSVDSDNGSLTVDADMTLDIETIAASGSISSGASIAGSAVINDIENNVSAYLDNTDADMAGAIDISAAYTGTSTFYGGTISGGSFGIGGTGVIDLIRNSSKAYVKNGSVLNTASRIDVGSDLSETLDVMTANLSGGSFAGALTASVTSIENTSKAYIEDSTLNNNVSDTSAQDITVYADNRVSVDIKAGSAAFSGTGGVGAASDTMLIRNTTQACIDNTDIVDSDDVLVELYSREDLDSTVVSGSISGAVGLAGSVSKVDVQSDNDAYITDSEIAADGDIDVNAENDSSITAIAGSAGIGGAVGVAGSVVIANIKNDTDSYITLSDIESDGRTSVTSDTEELITAYAATASLGAYVGAAGSVTVETIKSDSRAYIESSDLDTGDLLVEAKDDAEIDSKAGGASGGIVGVAASVDIAYIENDTIAHISDGSTVVSDTDVKVNAESDNSIDSLSVTASAAGVSVSGAVSVVRIGASNSADADDSIEDTSGSIVPEIKTNLAGDRFGGTSMYNDVDRGLDAGNSDFDSDDSFSSSSSFADEDSTHDVAAYIGDDTQISAGNDIIVTADDDLDISMIVGGVSAGILGVGGAVALGLVKSDTRAYTGEKAELNAGNNIEISSDVEMADADVDVLAGSAGAVGLGASYATVNSDLESRAYMSSGTVVHDAASVDIDSEMSSYIFVDGIGFAGGAGAVGVSLARGYELGLSYAYTGDNVQIGDFDSGDIVDDLSISADAFVQMGIESKAGAAGIVSGSGSDARAGVETDVKACTGSGVTVDVANDAEIKATGAIIADVDANGVSAGGVSVGVSIARAILRPTLTTCIGDNSVIRTGNDFLMRALYDYNSDLSPNVDRNVIVTANSATGALIGGTGSQAFADLRPVLRSYTGSNADITSAGNITIDAHSYAETDADADGHAYGGLAEGKTLAEAVIYNDIEQTIGQDSDLDAADILVMSQTYNDADATSYGGVGGLLASGGTRATAHISDDIHMLIDSGASLTADDDLTIRAVSQSYANSDTDIESGGAITHNVTKAETVIDADIDITIKSAYLEADVVKILAHVIKIKAVADAFSKTTAVDSTSEAFSSVDVESDLDIIIDDGAEIAGRDSIEISAVHENVEVRSNAKARIEAGLTGTVKAEANAELDLNADVDVRSGAVLRSDHMKIEAKNPKGDDLVYERNADAEGNTVVQWVLETVDKLVKSVSKIPIIGWIVKWVWKKVKEWVKHILHSDESASVTGDKSLNNGINFSGDIYQFGAGSARLLINSDGTLNPVSSVGATLSGSQIIVDDIINDRTASIEFLAEGGEVSGNGTIHMSKLLGGVDIDNDSSYELVIQDIRTMSDNEGEPDLTIEAEIEAYDFDIVTEDTPCGITIENNSDSDVVFAGEVLNATGSMSVHNAGGDVLAAADNLFELTSLDIYAHNGAIGSSSNRLNLRMYNDSSVMPELSFFSNAGLYLDLWMFEKAEEARESGFVLEKLRFKESTIGAETDILFSQCESLTYDTDGNEVINYTGGIYDFTENFLSGGDIRLNAGEFSGIAVNALLLSGFRDIIFELDADGRLSDSQIDYTDLNNSSVVRIENIGNNGGHVTINAGSVYGTGNIRTLDGYSRINITDNSLLQLDISGIDIAQQVVSSVFINGTDYGSGDVFNGLSFSDYGYSSGDVYLYKAGAGDVYLSGAVNNPSFQTRLIVSGGSVYSYDPTAVLIARDLFVSASGDCGDVTEPLYIHSTQLLNLSAADAVLIDNIGDLSGGFIDVHDLDLSVINGAIGSSYSFLELNTELLRNAYAKGDIFLNERTGGLNVLYVESEQGDAFINALNGVMSADEGVNIKADDLVVNSSGGAIDLNTSVNRLFLNAGQGINIVESDGVLVETAVSASEFEDINIKTLAGDINVGMIETCGSDVKLESARSIRDIYNDSDEDVSADNITLEAAGGYIDLDIAGAGMLDASALSLIDIEEKAGNMDLLKAVSQNSDIRLTAAEGDIILGDIAAVNNRVSLGAYGSIMERDDSDKANIISSSLDMLAETGSIGSLSCFLEIDSSNMSTGLVRAVSYGGIYIKEVDGILNIDQLISDTADVEIESASSILNGSGFIDRANIYGRRIIIAGAGDIGASGAPVVTDMQELLNAESAGSIHIKELNGDIKSEYIRAGGNIELFAYDGDVEISEITKSGWMHLNVEQQQSEVWTQTRNHERRRYVDQFCLPSLNVKLDRIKDEQKSLIDYSMMSAGDDKSETREEDRKPQDQSLLPAEPQSKASSEFKRQQNITLSLPKPDVVSPVLHGEMSAAAAAPIMPSVMFYEEVDPERQELYRKVDEKEIEKK